MDWTMASTKQIFFRLGAALVAVGVVVVLAAVWWGSSLYRSEQTDDERAAAAFADVRQRFAGVSPAFEVREARLVVTREPSQPSSSTTATTAYMLVWEPREQTLSRVTVPLWMSKVATEPIPLEALAGIGDRGVGALMEARRRGHELNIRISDLQRYGRTLLLDGATADGKRVIMWNE
jgi:hypothetical protein